MKYAIVISMVLGPLIAYQAGLKQGSAAEYHIADICLDGLIDEDTNQYLGQKGFDDCRDALLRGSK